MKKIIAVILVLISTKIIAQNVGVGTLTPNTSAMLDITSNTKGLLIPRMTTTERNAIPVDATTDGLMVYDTYIKSFFYHNTTGWVEISTGVAGANYWTLASNNINNNNSGNVGIGISGTNISEKFQVDANMKAGDAVWTGTENDRMIKFGDGNFVTIGETGQDDRMTLTGRNFIFTPSSSYPGFLGINTTTPSAPLSFGNILGEKINFWNTDATHNYGIGVQGGLLQIHANDATADIAFGTGISSNGAAFTETMRIKGNGNVGIGTNTPGAKLDVSGTFKLTDGTQASGKVLTTDGSGNASWQVQNSGFKNIAMFSTAGISTNWTVPAGVTNIYVEMWGGGGNGSTTVSNGPGFGGGGGGGAYASMYFNVTPGSNIAITVARAGNTIAPAYSQVAYLTNTIRANNGETPVVNFANALGGTVTNSGAYNIKTVDGETGSHNENSNYTIPAGFTNPGSYIEFKGGKGGNSFNGGFGGQGEVFLSGPFGYNNNGSAGGFPGGGGGAKTTTGSANSGAAGLVLIYY
jgi:hypothetical protein